LLYCLKAEKLNGPASIEEKNFVRRKLLQLSHQKWFSAAEVQSIDIESDSVSHQQTTKTSGIAVKLHDESEKQSSVML